MNYRGWMFVGFSTDYPAGKIKSRTFMNEKCLVYRAGSGKLNMIEPYCSHFGVNMETGRVVKDCIQCPMHGRVFNGDGRAVSPKQRAIRAYPVTELKGLAFAYFDQPGVAPQWGPPAFLDGDSTLEVLWHHKRTLEVHHPSVPLDNSVDPRHFEYTHSMFGKHVEDGQFTPDGHRALGTMATQLVSPLSHFAGGGRAHITTHFDSPLNTYLRTDTSGNISELCNFLTIIEGKKCVLTQVGVGQRTRKLADWGAHAVGFLGSWFATYEDAAVWNNRKVQEPDSYPHQTDKALAAFRDWFEEFAYESSPPAAPDKSPTAGTRRRLQQLQ